MSQAACPVARCEFGRLGFYVQPIDCSRVASVQLGKIPCRIRPAQRVRVLVRPPAISSGEVNAGRHSHAKICGWSRGRLHPASWPEIVSCGKDEHATLAMARAAIRLTLEDMPPRRAL